MPCPGALQTAPSARPTVCPPGIRHEFDEVEVVSETTNDPHGMMVSVLSPQSEPELNAYASEVDEASRSILGVTVAALESLERSVSPSQIRAMLALEQMQECGVSELAAVLGVFPSSASRLADRLTNSGLMSRVASPEDRRMVLLSLTPDGQRVLQDFHARRNEAFAAIAARMALADRRRLLRGLQAFSTAQAGLVQQQQ
jgi:DNA-binding MarR family transcriptional regulator